MTEYIPCIIVCEKHNRICVQKMRRRYMPYWSEFKEYLIPLEFGCKTPTDWACCENYKKYGYYNIEHWFCRHVK